MTRALRRLASLRLTIWVLAALAVLFLAGLWIPQKALFDREGYLRWVAANPSLSRVLDATGLTDVYASPIAIALWVIFFANLLAVMSARLPVILRRVALSGPIPDPSSGGFPFVRRLPAQGPGGLDAARIVLERRGYRVRRDGERLRAVRNRFSPLATPAFHLSFVVILAGGVATSLTRFQGRVDLGVGERFTGSLAQFVSRPHVARFATLPAERFDVEAVAPTVVDEVPVRLEVALRDVDGTARSMEVNRPHCSDAGTCYVLKDADVAPLLLVLDAEGRELEGGYVRLKLILGKPAQARLMGLPLEVRLFPDWQRVGEEDATRSREMRNPALQLAIVTEDGRTVRKTLRAGEELAAGAYRIRFAGWRYWIQLFVRSERGLGVLLSGFGLAATSLALRLLFFSRELVVALLPADAVEIAGRADYYRALFSDEFEAVVREVATALAAIPRVA